MSYAWLAVPLLIAVLDWVAISRNWMTVNAFAKQGVIIALIAWSWFFTDWRGAILWFGLALVFSLAGDIFLLSPRLFLPGMAAFFLAHIAYLLGFNLNTNLLSTITIGIVVGAVILVALFFARIRAALRRKPETRHLVIPVLIYGFALSLMTMSAISTLFRQDWTNVYVALLMAAGGILFFISDYTNARRRFVRPMRNDQLIVRITYHLAQMALITGAILHFT